MGSLVERMLGALLGALVAAAPPGGSIARTEGLIETFKAVHRSEGAPLTPEEQRQNQVALAALDGYFDFDRLVGDPMAPHEGKLDAPQLRRYREVFTELIRTVAWSNAGGFFREATWTLREVETAGGADVHMAARVPRKDLDTDVIFHWRTRGDGPLLLVDVSFDGDSLVADYRNQFGRILEREGAAALISRLERRLDEERARHGAAP